MDVFSKEERSKVMRAVKSNKNKSTELKLIEIFWQYGLKGWRRNYKVFGKPDFVFHKYKIAVFVDGCFWHGHDCRNTKPASNKDYWDEKIDRNIKRDKKVNSHLTNLGWKVIRIWECEIKKKPLEAADKIKKAANVLHLFY